MNINVSMKMEIENGSYDKLKTLEHHAEHLLDLDEWPEIKNVYDVRVQDANQDEAQKWHDLLNKIINQQQVGRNISDTIRWCLFVGFDKEDLIQSFGFNREDVEYAIDSDPF